MHQTHLRTSLKQIISKMPRQEGNSLLYCKVEQTGPFAALLPFLGYSSRMCAGAASPQRNARSCNVQMLDTDDNVIKKIDFESRLCDTRSCSSPQGIYLKQSVAPQTLLQRTTTTSSPILPMTMTAMMTRPMTSCARSRHAGWSPNQLSPLHHRCMSP